MEKYGAARQASEDNTIWCMRFACWINKVTDTYSEHVVLIVLRNSVIGIATGYGLDGPGIESQ